MHRPAGDPSPGGLVERFFGTSQQQFESEVRLGKILTLNEINNAFSSYLSVCYHTTIHSGTDQTPQQRYEQGLSVIRKVDINEVMDFFMKREERTVDKDYSDIRLDGKFYRVSPTLRKDKVQVRYDQYSDMTTVWIYSLGDEYLGKGILYNREYGADTTERVISKPKHNFIDLWNQQHHKKLELESSGIDYRKIVNAKAWPFAAFVQKLAKLMGLKGKLTDFTAGELETLKKVYNRIPDIAEPMLIDAFEKAERKTIAYIVYQLQIIKNLSS